MRVKYTLSIEPPYCEDLDYLEHLGYLGYFQTAIHELWFTQRWFQITIHACVSIHMAICVTRLIFEDQNSNGE